MEKSHLSEDKVALIFSCLRWGVSRKGIADICQVNLKTVHRCISKGAQSAKEFHEEHVKDLQDVAVQLDEAHGKTSGSGARWLAAAIACQSLLIDA